MIRLSPFPSALMAAVLALVPVGASAKVITLTLTGTVANAGTTAFTSGTRDYVQGYLFLDGLIPFDLEQGDIVDATITLDSPYVVPMSGEQLFAFSLLNPMVNPDQPTSNAATLTFGNSTGPTGLPSDTLFGACSNCLATITAGGGNSFSFDSLRVAMTIDQLTPNPFRIEGASVNYQLSDALAAVPEPATWTMLILGFGLTGALLRRRGSASAPALDAATA